MNNGKRTFTLNLCKDEMDTLEELARAKDLSKAELVRRLIRFYAAIEGRLDAGDRLVFVDERTGRESGLIVV